ncbi:MAG: FmdE family protein [bacterium]
MINQEFNIILEAASRRHGHLCPSLYFGVSCAYHALKDISGSGEEAARAVINGSSKCIRDGAGTALETLNIEGESRPQGKPVGVIVHTSDNTAYGVFVKEKIKAEINRLNASLSTEEFQEKGVSYLRSLSLEEFLDKQET